MTDNYKQRINKAENKVLAGQLDILQTNFDKIKDIYISIDIEARPNLIKRLESIISDKEITSVFNCQIAKQKRKETGLSLRKLGREIGISQQALSNYERGRPIPTPNKIVTEKYLNWLKSQNYNPFDL